MNYKSSKTLKIFITTVLLAGSFAFPAIAQNSDNIYPTFASYSPSSNLAMNYQTRSVLNTVPQFNIFTPYSHTQAANQDYYLLDMKNNTKGGSFNDPISADPGDILTFSVFYHNGVINTVANNTRIKVGIPSANGTQIISTAFLSADNANSVSETGTVNISSPAYLQYISGSARWFPNQTDDRFAASAYFPFGQSGDEIISNGINIGNIQGCWQYSGYINFQVRVIGFVLPPPPPQQPQQVIKTVTGAGDITGTATEAAGASGFIVAAIYLAKKRLDLLTKLKLGAYTLGIRSFGKFRKPGL